MQCKNINFLQCNCRGLCSNGN